MPASASMSTTVQASIGKPGNLLVDARPLNEFRAMTMSGCAKATSPVLSAFTGPASWTATTPTSSNPRRGEGRTRSRWHHAGQKHHLLLRHLARRQPALVLPEARRSTIRTSASTKARGKNTSGSATNPCPPRRGSEFPWFRSAATQAACRVRVNPAGGTSSPDAPCHAIAEGANLPDRASWIPFSEPSPVPLRVHRTRRATP
jgi:hypothetical protein